MGRLATVEKCDFSLLVILLEFDFGTGLSAAPERDAVQRTLH